MMMIMMMTMIKYLRWFIVHFEGCMWPSCRSLPIRDLYAYLMLRLEYPLTAHSETRMAMKESVLSVCRQFQHWW